MAFLLPRARYAAPAAALMSIALLGGAAVVWPRHRAAEQQPSRPPAPKIAPARPGTPADWSCFRGSHCGVSAWDNAPLAWNGPSGAGVLWKKPLQATGVSSPVLWGNRIYLSEGDENGRALLALDDAAGREVWRQVVPDGGQDQPLPPVSDAGLALPTPACDADGVYVLFGTGDLAAFAHDGRPKWRMFLKRPEIGYGFASSPLVARGLVLVQFDEINGGRVLAVDTATGRIKWQQPRSRGPSWCSPIIIPGPDGTEQTEQLVVNANGSATAYDLAGKMLWDVEGVNGQVTPSPAWWNGRVYLVNTGARLVCYKLSKDPQVAWQATKYLSDVPSPVALDGLLFVTTSGGQLACLDATTGAVVWTHKGPRCYASLVASGHRVYALCRDGTTQIVAVDRKFHELGTCTLGEGSDATPALADGRMYIRGRNNLWCLGGRAGEQRSRGAGEQRSR